MTFSSRNGLPLCFSITSVYTLVRKNSENRKQSQVYLNNAEMHPVLR